MSPAATSTDHLESDPTDKQRDAVFWEWAFSCEATGTVPQLMLIIPLIVLGWGFWLLGPAGGRQLTTRLADFAAIVVCVGGAVHAARAFCWEASSDQRELVLLTGLKPLTLLTCKTAARWWTIVWALVLMLPWVFLARTLGGFSFSQLFASFWTLLMLAFLTASFALIAAVASTEVENSATTATVTTVVLLLLYHGVFWLVATCLDVLRDPRDRGLGDLYNLAWQSAPATAVMRANSDPDTFSLLSPSYWIHFLPALLGFRMASIVMANRFRTLKRPSNVAIELPTATSVADLDRPRCSENPFLWKDFHVLAGGFKAKRRWTICYWLLALGIFVIGLLNSHTGLPLIVGITMVCLGPVVFAYRLDTLMVVEFREQTWQSLMLLPIDRRWIMWSKLRAVVQEQRAIVVPLVTAIAFAFPRGPMVMGMTAFIAFLIGIAMCQASLVNHLLSRSMWNGPLPAGGTMTLAALFIMFASAGNLWMRFAITVGILIAILLLAQQQIHRRLRTWTEQPNGI